MARLRSTLQLMVLPLAAVAGDTSNTTEKPYFGNVVPGRNVPPPTNGCVVTDRTYLPLTPLNLDAFTVENGWDWCQYKCQTTYLSRLTGESVPCAHFTYFPDGKCYLQDDKATLQKDRYCNNKHPCSYGYEVISGPASCDNVSLWAVPPSATTQAATTAAPAPQQKVETTAAPTAGLLGTKQVHITASLDVTDAQALAASPVAVAATTAALARVFSLLDSQVSANLAVDPADPSLVVATGTATFSNGQESLMPNYLTVANAGAMKVALQEELTTRGARNLVNAATVSMQGATATKATQVVVADIPEGQPCNGHGKTCAASLMCIGATLDIDGICVADLVDTTTGAPTTSTAAPTSTRPPSTTAAALPDGLIVGYYYEPHLLAGTVRTTMPDWRACMAMCASDPLCKHFGYWPDGGCVQQGADVKMVKARCAEGETTCPGLQVITGPRDLAAKDLWSVLPVETTTTPPAMSSRPSEAPAPTTQPPQEVKISQMQGGSAFTQPWYTIVLEVAAVVLIGGIAYTSWKAREDNESEDQESDEESWDMVKGAAE